MEHSETLKKAMLYTAKFDEEFSKVINIRNEAERQGIDLKVDKLDEELWGMFTDSIYEASELYRKLEEISPELPEYWQTVTEISKINLEKHIERATKYSTQLGVAIMTRFSLR